MIRSLTIAVLVGLALLFAGCATEPAAKGGGYSSEKGEQALAAARSMIGRPYRFKGESPKGFDCSGLVRYSYRAAGIDLPHSTGALRKVSRPVAVKDLRKGDLVFFDQSGRKFSHVGLYAGDGGFIHAPSSGKSVRMSSLHDAYWKKHFLEARRP